MNYTFYSTTSAISAYCPATITFQPSYIHLTSGQFLSKIVYQLPDKTVTLTNNFTVTPDSNDCRSDYTYTIPYSQYTQVMIISAFIGPDSFIPTVYKLSATNLLPYLTTNPRVVSPSAYAFGEVHLLRSRAWGTVNTQMFLLETNNPNYLLINYNG